MELWPRWSFTSSMLRPLAIKMAAHARCLCGIPHQRHAFVTLSLDAGVLLRDVQDAAGHADPRTTRRYDRACRFGQAPNLRAGWVGGLRIAIDVVGLSPSQTKTGVGERRRCHNALEKRGRRTLLRPVALQPRLGSSCLLRELEFAAARIAVAGLDSRRTEQALVKQRISPAPDGWEALRTASDVRVDTTARNAWSPIPVQRRSDGDVRLTYNF